MEPSRHHRSGPFGVVDIGTTKIACLIGRVESDGSLRVLGFGWQKGRGLNSGDITDLEAAEKAIRACVGQAEDMADVRLRSVTVNLTCGQPESRLFNVQWPVGGRAVTENDIRGVLNEGRGRAEVDGREPIHVLPLNFAVDATDHVTDPRGLFCTTLNARLHVIDAAATALRTMEVVHQPLRPGNRRSGVGAVGRRIVQSGAGRTRTRCDDHRHGRRHHQHGGLCRKADDAHGAIRRSAGCTSPRIWRSGCPRR